MEAIPVSPDERRWRAEDDARTLARAMRIQKDTARLRAATEAAERMAKEQREEANNLGAVSRKKSTAKAGKSGRKKSGKSSSTTQSKVTTKFNVFKKI